MSAKESLAHPRSPRIERRLAAILHADAYGYSRLLNEDESGTLRVLTPLWHCRGIWCSTAEVMRLTPQFSLEEVRQNLPIKDPAVLERDIDAWRKAGLK